MTKLDVMLTSKLVHPFIRPCSTHPSYQTLKYVDTKDDRLSRIAGYLQIFTVVLYWEQLKTNWLPPFHLPAPSNGNHKTSL